MNPKKQKEKDRRRARKLAEEAWEAANEGNFDLAEKIIRRAVGLGVDLSLTSSCYDPLPEGTPCGECDAHCEGALGTARQA